MIKKMRATVRKNLKLKIDQAEHINEGKKGEIRPFLHAKWEDGLKEGTIVAIGINPSTANNEGSDNTLTRLCKLVDMYGYHELIMLNLFESSTKVQEKIVMGTATDFTKYTKLFEQADMILIVWGVDEKKYSDQIVNAKQVLADYKEKIYCIQRVDKNGKIRKPLHPSRIAYTVEINEYTWD